jgi:hypothetical protein
MREFMYEIWLLESLVKCTKLCVSFLLKKKTSKQVLPRKAFFKIKALFFVFFTKIKKGGEKNIDFLKE